MCRFRLKAAFPLLAASLLAGLGGCAELRGRKNIQQGNDAYKARDFATAVAYFDRAAVFVPDMPLLWLNRGYACRELLIPGASAATNARAAACALQSFKRLRELAPADPRGDRLYVQTLLDLGEYPTIERTFSLRHERDPADLDVVLVLEQVYAKMGRWREALVYYKNAAALRPQDAEAQYAVGTFIWQVLHSHGGADAQALFDPRPRPDGPAPLPPPPGAGDITGAARVALADEGISYLTRAAALRPGYKDALTYRALLYRQQSFALFGDVAAWERAVAQASVDSAAAGGSVH